MNKLIKELRELCAKGFYDTDVFGVGTVVYSEDVLDCLSRHDHDTEPLAVLADRKGYDVQTSNLYGPTIFLRQRIKYMDGHQERIMAFEARGKTMLATEDKARQFFDSLEDKKI